MVSAPERATVNYDALARNYIQALMTGNMPDDRPLDFGPWDTRVGDIERAYARYKGDAARTTKYVESLYQDEPALKALLAPPPSLEIVELEPETVCPQLPEAVQLPDTLARGACPWWDEYIAFSKIWSPRGYESYHEAVGAALLSTVAGRRVAVEFGGLEYTPLYMALVGDTTLWKKTTTAKFYFGLLEACGLDWLLGADVTTPQKLLSDMAARTVPANYGQMSPEEKEYEKKRLAMAGQRGWYYDEFGMHMDQMVRENGTMADFKGLLRVLDDCRPRYSTSTISRGRERVEKPYLSLLAALTVADIKPYADKRNKFWKDGLFARFAFATTHFGAKSKRDRFPVGSPQYPASLIHPLRQWHDWLGEPEIEITEETAKNGNVTGYTLEVIQPLPERICIMPPEVLDALYAYENALLDMVEEKKVPEALKGSYGRFHKLALRVAALIASLSNGGRIEMRHWARAQQFAENRRHDLHELFAQANIPEESESVQLENEIIRHMERLTERGKEWVTANDLRPYISGQARGQIEDAMMHLARAGTLEKQPTKRVMKYRLPASEPEV